LRFWKYEITRRLDVAHAANVSARLRRLPQLHRRQPLFFRIQQDDFDNRAVPGLADVGVPVLGNVAHDGLVGHPYV
jgi:hypothetical protein